MLCNLVSLRQLQKQGIWWDTRPEYRCLRRRDNTILCQLLDRYDQFVLEYLSPQSQAPGPRVASAIASAFVTRRKRFNSWTKRKRLIADAVRWHQRLGHPGPDALEHLVNCSEGVRLRGPTTVQCDACGTSKIRRQVRRQPRALYEGPAERLAIDFHDYEEGLGDYSSLMLITDRWSGLIWDYYLQDRTALTIIAAIDSLFKILSRQFKVAPKVVECDNEIMQVKPQIAT